MENRLRNQFEKFVKLTDADWQLLLDKLYLKKLNKKDYLIQIGEQGKEIGVVVTGSFRQYYEKDGDERTTYFFFEDMLITAYVSCLTSQSSELAIQALEDSEVLCFKYSDWQILCESSITYQKLARNLAEYVAIGLEIRMVDLLMLSPEERYIKFLESNKKRIIERIPQHYIASYLGITPVSLSRIRNRIM